jgi:hypothetical protein
MVTVAMLGVLLATSRSGLVLHCLGRAPKVVRITDVQPLKADTESTRRNLGLAPLHRDDRIVWVHDHRNPCGSRAHIEVQQFFSEGGEPVKLAVGEPSLSD